MSEDGVLPVKTGKQFAPLLAPARYKALYGGRGSGKSHFMAELVVEYCYQNPGTSAVMIREVQKDLAHSSKRLIEQKIRDMGLEAHFRRTDKFIETRGGGVMLFQGMQDHTKESIKSLEGFKIAWIEEAQTLSDSSLEMLRPTIRMPGSMILACWNPRRKSDAIDRFFRPNPPENSIVREVNWNDNPWFPDVLKEERLHDLEHYPDRYPHIWEGAYATAGAGAYYAQQLMAAKHAGRICKLVPDPILKIKAFWDIGGAGKSSDAMSIWVTQWVDREIRVLDYIEGQGQVLSYYVNELRKKGYEAAHCYLPHDGMNTNNVTGKRIKDHLEDAEFIVDVISNQGMGAANQRIASARRIFPIIYFDEEKTEAGRDALGFYHEKRDDKRNVGLGPEHDWSSHAADAFGMMCVAYEAPLKAAAEGNRRRGRTASEGGWLRA